MVEKIEKFDARDVVQIAIGSFTGGLSFLLSGNVADVGEKIPIVNVVFVILVSVVFAYLSSYSFGVRKLGKKHLRVVLGVIPERIFVQYFLALPATVFGSAADLIGSKQ